MVAVPLNRYTETNLGGGEGQKGRWLSLNLNLNFSERVVTSTGFHPLSLIDMDHVKLDGVRLTAEQADALNVQAAVQVLGAANVALGGAIDRRSWSRWRARRLPSLVMV